MTRRLGWIIVVAVLLAACGSDDDNELGINDEGVLSVCSDIPYPPFEFEESNRGLVGIDADLVRAVAEELGVEAKFKDTDFDGIFDALAANECDLIASSVSITEERKKQNDFTQGYFEIHQSLLVRAADKDKYAELTGLTGSTVGVQSGTTGADYARANAKGTTIKEFTGADELVTSLRAGQIDAVLQDYPVNAYQAEASDGALVVSKRFDEGAAEQYGFVVRKSKRALREAVDEALTKIRADGRYDEILKTYLGDQAATG